MSGSVNNSTILGAGVSAEDDKRKSKSITRRAHANEEAESLQFQITSNYPEGEDVRHLTFSPGGNVVHNNFTTLGSELGLFAASELKNGQQYSDGPSPKSMSNAFRYGSNVRTWQIDSSTGWSLVNTRRAPPRASASVATRSRLGFTSRISVADQDSSPPRVFFY
jgi:hypothetical protein